MLLASLLGLATGTAQGQVGPTFFAADAAARTAAAAAPRATTLTLTLTRAQALTLDEPGLRAALATAPPESRAGAAPLVLALPQPDGRSARFALREAPVMEPALAARYPQIRTYAGVGLDDATATVRLDLTPAGFHAQVLSSAGGGFDIDPVSPADQQHYLSYYQQEARPAAGKTPGCGAASTPAEALASAARVAAWRGAGPQARLSGAQVRTYRLALTCTPEYSITKGNTVASVLAGEVVTLNRVVGIFEREVSVRFSLVANNDRLIFLSGTGPQPSPTLTNSNQNFALLDENQANIDRVIGNANYDIGHVFCTTGGGVAGVGVLCLGGSKAKGVSGDDVKVICHEMGHQLGAMHTFNTNDSNRWGSTAWEPGSGATIMSYGGIFGPSDDVQDRSDDLFHTGSYEQMQATISARNCGTLTATGNLAPVVTGPASGKTLPLNTPFRLTATATDANNDPLTYSWEQFDVGPAGNLTMPQVTGETPPLFRTRPPVASPTRYFPRLDELVNNTTAPGERLPTVARTLKFRCTARDVHDGLVGVVGGVDYSTLVSLNVSAAAGPFVVSAPNAAGTSWAGGSTQTVTWNVANTTAAPVSCALVNLRLSLDGGLTYPLTLATNVPNNGSASISVPNAPTATARVMVEAADNYFFNISNADFAITPGPGPVISSFTPARGPVGTVVTLTGTGFTGATAVRFNGTAAASFTVVSATSLRATVAAGSSSGLLSVTTPAGTGSSATPFLVGAPPTITSFTPASGPVATIVTLTGTGFLGATGVTLNGVAVPDFFLNSANQLTLVLPDNATTGLLAVTTALGTGTSATVFTVPPRPAITRFTPSRGPVGTVVVLTGTNLAGATAVSFNGVSAPVFTVNSATQITATVPAGATTGPLAATTPQGAGVSGNAFTVIPPPTLTLLSPASGVVGTVLDLTGTDLSGTSAVTFTSGSGAATPAAAGYVVASGTRITGVRVPGTLVPGTYTLTITAPSGLSNGLPFGVLSYTTGPAPTITSFVRTSGTVGATIRLVGTGLSSTTQITFGGSSGNVVSSGFAVNAAGTEISGIVVPAGAVTGPLTATTPNGTSAPSPQPFVVNALPVALGQNVTLTLDANGSATLAATAVNVASTANGGLATASDLSMSPGTFSCADVRPAPAASALRFNGSGQYVDIDRAATVPRGNSPYTIEAWIKPTSMGSYGIIGWGGYGGGSAANALRLKPTGLINYWLGNDLEVTTANLAGAWHHVAATCDGTTRTLYLDGVAVGSDQPGPHNVPDARNLRIGSTNSGEFFNGLIDEVRVWSVARTAGQLSAGRGLVLPANSAGLLAYYRLSEGSGLATADATGTAANVGTLTGGPTWTTDAAPLVAGVVVTLTVTDADGNTSTVPAAVTVLPPTATAWTGAVSADWATPGNWGGCGAPSATMGALVGPAARQPVVNGTQVCNTLTLNSSASLTLAANATLTASGNAVLGAGSTLTQAAGSTLYLGGDLTNNGAAFALSATSTVGFGIAAPDHTLGGTTGLTFQNLSLGERPSAGAFDRLRLAVPVAVAGKLDLRHVGTVEHASGGSLTLLSSAAGTALVVQDDNSAVTGTATVQRYLDPRLNPGPGYRHYSAPVSGSTVADLVTAGFAPEISQASAYNASATPAQITPFPTVYAYDQARVALANAFAPFDRGFVVPATLSTPLVVGQGYAVHLDAAQLVDFTGLLTTGTRTLGLTRNATGSSDDAAAGWALVGNPYPAPLDWSRVAPADRPGLDAAMYVFESSSPYAGSYRASVNGVGGNGNSGAGLIATAQGFFVRVSSGQTSGQLTFRNAQRLTDATPVAMLRAAADPRPRVQLDLRGASGPADAFVAYAEIGASPAFDAAYDARKLPNPTGLNLAAVAATGEALAIDGHAAFTAATVLPLTVGVPAAGSYVLRAAALDNLPATLDAFLSDAATGQTVNLRQQPAHAFSVSPAQAAAPLSGRFALRFAARTALATVPGLTAADVALYPNPAHAAFAVRVPAVAGTATVRATLLNALGQVVRTQAAALPAAGTTLTFETAGLATGVYALRLQAGPVVLAKRVVIQ